MNHLDYFYTLILMHKIVSELSKELDIPEESILGIYKSYWKYIRDSITILPFNDELGEESFNKYRTNFNIPNLGKLVCTYERYKKIKNYIKRREDAKHKKD